MRKWIISQGWQDVEIFSIISDATVNTVLQHGIVEIRSLGISSNEELSPVSASFPPWDVRVVRRGLQLLQVVAKKGAGNAAEAVEVLNDEVLWVDAGLNCIQPCILAPEHFKSYLRINNFETCRQWRAF